jgi:hypothetical protein
MNAKIPAEVDSTKTSIPAPDIRTALRDILHSEAFSNSKRSCDFLSYVVEQALAGSQHELKERTIAVAVFGRTPSYDSHEDAIVRIKASEVRKRLGHYYAVEGRDAAIRVSLPRGGYVPVFTPFDRRAEEVLLDRHGLDRPGQDRPVDENIGETGEHEAIKDKSVVPQRAPERRQKIILAFAGSVLVLAVAWAWFHTRSKPTFLEQFWAPALRSSEPVYLVAAAAPVFVSYAPGETLPPTNRTEYVAVDDQFVGEGDLLASHLIASMLQGMHQPYEVKGNNTIDVRDLPTRTVVLIGYSSTKWESICKQLRFYIDADKAGMITDRGKETEWYPRHVTKDLHTDEDYAIVSRFLDPSTRAMVVLVSGSEQYGTEGAAMLVTNPDFLRNALRDRPPGWERKNLQIVLHMKVIANSPTTPEVVATYYW